jgi:hypothetical protein
MTADAKRSRTPCTNGSPGLSITYSDELEGGPNPALQENVRPHLSAEVDDGSAVLRFANAPPGGNQRIGEVPADRHDVVGGEPLAHHFVLHGIGTALRKSLIISHRTHRIGVTGDEHTHHAARHGRHHRLFDHLLSFGR